MKLLIIFLFSINSLFSQGVYRDSINYLRVEFSEPILYQELILKENWLVTNSSAQIVNITGIGFNNDIVPCYGAQCEDTASMHAVLQFDQLQWGMNYNIQLSNAHDTAGHSVNLEFDNVDWSFEDERDLTLPNISLVDPTALRIIAAIASGVQVPNIPENVYDGDLITRWASSPIPQWIRLELNAVKKIKQVNISFFGWDSGRICTFNIDVSVGGILWTPVAINVTSGNTLWKSVTFVPVDAKYVRITVTGNNQATWANIFEIQVKE